MGGGDSGGDTSGSGATGTGATSAAQQNQQSGSTTGTGCMPALVLAGMALSLFVSRN
jgi:hypothetical protein